MKVAQRNLNLVVLAMLVVMGVVLGYVVGTYRTEYRLRPYLWRGNSELEALATRYGATRNSRYGEEWIVRDFFDDRRGGVFVDVGANHYQRDSNTYYLETALGWSGLAIEPQTQFAADYATFRPRTRFVAMFASDVTDRRVTLFVPPNATNVASATNDFASMWGKTASYEVPTTTLDHALEQAGITGLDFVSMDIELHEPQALAGFDIKRYRPALVCIEAHLEERQAILDYFHQRGYVIVGKYLRADRHNLYFTPAS